MALKFLLPNLVEHAQAVTRFLNEARAAAQIRSEHVARVLDVDSTPDGGAYMVLEYLEGVDLSRYLHDRGPLPVLEAVDFMLQALEAIAQAHALGIVHRDLKPANLFHATRADGGAAVVKVLDFGISKAAGASGSSGVTATSHMLGSPSYMSPEQIKSSKTVDARSDIWSLGVILFNLVTGKLPFPGENFGEVFAAIFEGNPPKLRELRPDAPEELEAIISRCLVRDREQRFQNVAMLAEALAPLAPVHSIHLVESVKRIITSPAPHSARPTSSFPGQQPASPGAFGGGRTLLPPEGAKGAARAINGADALASNPPGAAAAAALAENPRANEATAVGKGLGDDGDAATRRRPSPLGEPSSIVVAPPEEDDLKALGASRSRAVPIAIGVAVLAALAFGASQLMGGAGEPPRAVALAAPVVKPAPVAVEPKPELVVIAKAPEPVVAAPTPEPTPAVIEKAVIEKAVIEKPAERAEPVVARPIDPPRPVEARPAIARGAPVVKPAVIKPAAKPAAPADDDLLNDRH